MRIDTGKDGKRRGATKPSEARKFDADGTTPGKPLHPITKRFGYTYEWSFLGRRWSRQCVWFKTERSRDQSLSKFSRTKSEHIRNIKPVSR